MTMATFDEVLDAMRRPLGAPVWVGEGEHTLAAKWWDFHREHPEVYDALVKLARRALRRGQKRLGIGMLWEVMRWRSMLGADVPEEDEYVLNNNHRAYYARYIMETCPDMEGIFLTRAVGRRTE